MVYVDPLNIWGGDEAPFCFRNKPSCHLYADSLDELHAFAKRIGLRYEWFQNNRTLQHYDLTVGRREAAIKLGAIQHDRRQAIEKWRELRRKPKSNIEK